MFMSSIAREIESSSIARESIDDILTVPNAISAARLAAVPHIASRLEEHPSIWLPAAILMSTDMVDGALARLGDNSERLRRMGFRRSEAGKILDHGTDKIAAPLMLRAGMNADIIPRSLGYASLMQKAALGAYATHRYLTEKPIEVSTLGKRAEFATVLGCGSLFIAESLSPPKKRRLRACALGFAALGVAGSIAASIDYSRQSHQQ